MKLLTALLFTTLFSNIAMSKQLKPCYLTNWQIERTASFVFGKASASLSCRFGTLKYCSQNAEDTLGLHWVFKNLSEYKIDDSKNCNDIKDDCFNTCMEVAVLEEYECKKGCLQ